MHLLTGRVVVVYSGNVFFFCSSHLLSSLFLLQLPRHDSVPGSHSRPCSPLPTTVRAYVFIARRVQHFLPSSIRIELFLHTL